MATHRQTTGASAVCASTMEHTAGSYDARLATWARIRGLSAIDATRATYAMALILGIFGLARVAVFYHDDAFISLRYAARLLAGDGLSWNPGERVEGFTHPLWLAQVAVLGAVGMDLETASRCLGVLYLAGVAIVWWRTGAAAMLLPVVVTQPGLLLWSVSGLETASFAFWLVLGAWLAWEASCSEDQLRWRGGLVGVAFAAAALTRPEGVGATVVAVGWLILARRWSAAGTAAIAFAAIGGSYEIFRIAYFNDVVPNTAYVKLDGLPLSANLAAAYLYLRSHADVWGPSVIAATAAWWWSPSPRPLGMLAVATPPFVSALMAGGDHMPMARLLVPSIVVVVFAAAVAGRSGFRRPRAVTALAALAVLGHAAVLLLTPMQRDAAAVTGEHVGRFLQTFLPPGTVVATATAGSTPYFAPSLRFIDTLGLNDRHIARRRVGAPVTRWQDVAGHLKGDGAYVLRRAPDVVILGPAEGFEGTDPRQWFLTDFELLGSPAFRARYRPYRFSVAIDREALQRRPLPDRTDGNPFLGIVLYLRVDSAAVAELAHFGKPMS